MTAPVVPLPNPTSIALMRVAGPKPHTQTLSDL